MKVGRRRSACRRPLERESLGGDLSLDADEVSDAPTHFVEACRAVGRDAHCFSEFDKYSSRL